MSGLHVVILAAGKGSRLGALVAGRPKWLLEVGGRPIASSHLDAVRLVREQDPGALASVRVVTGHEGAVVDAFLDPADDVQVVFNPSYAELNNWYSVLAALRSIDDPGAPVAVVNSDLFAPAAWIAAFLRAAASTDREALIAVDLERRLTDESMKVAATGPLLAAIGKVGVDDPVGEYVGLLMARGTALERFRESLESFLGVPEHVNEWYERAVGLTAADGVPWTVWPTPDSGWVEIDDDADHAAAERLAAGGG